LEVFSWWQQQSERKAFDRLVTLHQASHPQVKVHSAPDAAAELARDALTARMLAGAAPATFQANVGADLLRWTTVDSTSLDGVNDTERRIEDLTELYRDLNLTRVIPAPILEALSIGGASQYYAVPIDIHRLNMIYYRTESLKAFEAKYAGSFLDIDVLCPKDPLDTPPLDIKIAISTDDQFSLVLLVFENILPALSGGDFYDRLFRGQAPTSNGGGDWTFDVRRALHCLKYLSRSFVEQHNQLTWASATVRVIDEEASFTVMGDWAEGLLTDALARGSVQSSVFPGTEEVFVFTADAFPLPVATPHPAEAEAFLRTISSGAAQLAFSREKGSIPARTDFDAELDPRSIQKRWQFDHTRPLLATSGLFPSYFPTKALSQVLRELVYPGSAEEQIEKVITLLRDAYPLFARWQHRLAQPAAPLP
jgi:glucose/mannose transport system substrate-binding protein